MTASPRAKTTTQENLPDVQQRQASNPAASVWVNASAGSGKTTVLTNRVLRLLLERVVPERILCLTYTRAAAAEMANRVTAKLSNWATCEDNELSASIADLQDAAPTPAQMTEARRLFARVLACPGGMRIRTIHAFCQEILRRFPIEAGLVPHFTVIDDTDAQVMQDEVRADLLREAGTQSESALGQALKILVCDLGENRFADSMQGILAERARLQAAIIEAGGLEKLIGRMRAALSLKPADTSEHIIKGAVSDKTFDAPSLRQAANWLAEDSTRYAPRGQGMLAWLALSENQRATRFEDYFYCFYTQKDTPFSPLASNDMLARHPGLPEILGQEVTRLGAVRERLDAAQMAENTAAVLTFGAAFMRGYEERKRTKALLDYDDLIMRTDALLRRPGIAPWILYKLDGGIDHILVDEAQDTSRAQWDIVAALAEDFFAGESAHSDKNRTLFVVGDEKQSIFSFQRADPEAFASMRLLFNERINAAGKKYQEIPMRASYRSAPAILNGVDAVFTKPRVQAGVSLEPIKHNTARREGKPERAGRVEVWKLQQPGKKDKIDESWMLPLDYEREHDTQTELAKQIADTIQEWLIRKEMLPGVGRPVHAGDIMILLRRRGALADLLVRALKERHIPVTGVDRMRLVKQLSVMDLLALVQFVLLPEDDLNLASVLRGPLLGFSEDQLMALALKRGDQSLWQSLNAKADADTGLRAARDYLLKNLNRADFITPFALLTDFLSETCPGSEISGRHAIWRRLGPDALDPMEELLNSAQDFSSRYAPSLQNFLHWLMASESEIKRELDRGGGQVRIMTVHASKGLEAPIVFLPDASAVPRSQDITKFLWNENNIPLYIARKPKNGSALNLWSKARQKQLEEYRRLLYVALTRPETQLYIAGWGLEKKQPDDQESWYNLALEGLRPLDQEALRKNADHIEIAFADPILPPTKVGKEEHKNSVTIKALPVWARQPASQEVVSSRHIAPSQVEISATASPDAAFARGRIIHRLLQSLPDVVDAKRDDVAARFLANPQYHLSPAQQKEIQKEVLDVVRDATFGALFGPESRAEIPIVGRIGGEEITGQVDRICVLDGEVWIIDYKTNRPPPKNVANIPDAYRLQLANYRAVLKEIYPNFKIRCFLLWTYKLRLMEVPESLMSAP